MVRVEAGPAREIEDPGILDEWSKGFLDVSALDKGDRTFAYLVVGRPDGLILSCHVAIQGAAVLKGDERCWCSLGRYQWADVSG